ncbi:MAG: hypothetical protein ACD_23C00252G0004 [uncultured bacterium]|nr:MAG: hypothetical protein ACD_23C00252G0004 [uncultured bacterium]
MNVIIQIKGHEAIPVRAIPLLTNWRFMSPDVVAHVLGGTGGSNVSLFGDMKSYRVENGEVHSISQDWWAQFPLKRLRALTKQITAAEPIYEVGYSEWQKQSLKELPAGAFVWKDDYQKLHDKNWYSQYNMLLRTLQGLNGQDDADDSINSSNLTSEELTDDSSLTPDMRESKEQLKRWHERNLSPLLAHDSTLLPDMRESIEILKHWREPDFSPFMNADQQQLVMEGFEGLLTRTTAPAQTITTAPVEACGDGLVPTKRSRKPSWSTVAMPYMRQVYSEGKFKSAVVFYKALLSRADTPNSPFTKLKGELYCEEAGTTVAEGTVGTKWAEIRSR